MNEEIREELEAIEKMIEEIEAKLEEMEGKHACMHHFQFQVSA